MVSASSGKLVCAASPSLTCRLAIVYLLAAATSCVNPTPPGWPNASSRTYEEAGRSAPMLRSARELADHQGKIVTVQGRAYNVKLGAAVTFDGVGVVVGGKTAWPADVVGHDVVVCGTLIRHDYGQIDDVKPEDLVAQRACGGHWFLENATVSNQGQRR